MCLPHRQTISTLTVCFLFWIGAACDGAEDVKPNVLFIAVDDMNDWVGCLGGHPQAKTPNIDALAERGILFEEAYCAAPLCNPSRTAVMTGLRPSTTGIYGNLNFFRNVPGLEGWVTIPQYFREHGYVAWTGGKIFHMARGEFSDPVSWDQQYSTMTGTPAPPVAERYSHGMRPEFKNEILARLMDWSPIRESTEETADWKTAEGAAEFLAQDHEQPFFLACGIYRPHLSWYAPQNYFDMHPLEDIQLPAFLETDLDDIPPVGKRMAGEEFGIVKRSGEWERAVQGYLAASSFADACVGRVMEALDQSEYRNNTIVVLWGDHGFNIGDKHHIAKSALWEQTTHTPLIIHVPEELAIDSVANGQRCASPVSLVDIFPTLIELCGLPDREDLDGKSLVPLLQDPNAEWPWPAIISHCPHWHGQNHAVRGVDFHYILYRDGREELYNNHNDPNQWHNLADDPDYSDIKSEYRKWIPKNSADHYRGGEGN